MLRQSLNIALAFILAFQILLITFFIFYDTQAVSDFLEKKLNSGLNLFNLEADATSIKLKPNGTIEVADFTLSLQGTGSLLLKCEKAILHPDLPRLLIGQFEIDKAQIESGTLYCPAPLSPTGIQEPIISNIRTSVAFKKNAIQVESLALNLFSSNILSDGILSIPVPPKKNHATDHTLPTAAYADAATSWLALYAPWIKKSFSLKQYIDAFEKVSIVLTPPAVDKKKAHLSAIFFGNNYKPNQTLTIGHLTAQADINLSGTPFLSPEVYLKINNATWKGLFNTQAAEAIATLSSHAPFTALPEKLLFSAQTTLIKNKASIPFSTGNLSLKTLPRLTGTLQIVDGKEWILANAAVNLTRQTADITAQGKFNPTRPSVLAFFSTTNGESPVIFHQTPFCAVDLHFKKRFKFDKAKAWINADETVMYRTPFSSLYARGEVTPQQLSLDTLYLKTPKSHAKASYIHNFKTNNYQALAKGQLNPADIDPWMGPWWQKLWSDFSFLKEQPYADIEVSGNWDNEDDYFTFGKIEGTNFIFRKVFNQLCRLTLQANPNHTSISKLYLKTPTGSANANLFWKFKPQQEPDYEQLNYDIKSTLRLADLGNLLGPEAQAIIKPFHCAKPPAVHIRGQYTLPNLFYSHQDRLYIYFLTKHPLTYHDIALDHLRFKANYDTTKTIIAPIDFGFAGGIGNASATVTLEANEKNSIAYDVQIEKASFDKTLANLNSLKGNNQTSKPDKPFHGELSGVFTGTGYLGDTDSYMGEGVLMLQNANLGRIRLLGLLSEMLDIPPFHFSNFDLTEGETMFRLKHQVLYFNHTKIFGQSARIQANGTYNIMNDEVYFLMDIFPTAELKIPVISQALAVINPISNFFQVELTNTLADPKWSLRLTPFGLFKKKTNF